MNKRLYENELWHYFEPFMNIKQTKSNVVQTLDTFMSQFIKSMFHKALHRVHALRTAVCWEAFKKLFWLCGNESPLRKMEQIIRLNLSSFLLLFFYDCFCLVYCCLIFLFFRFFFMIFNNFCCCCYVC